MLNPAPQALRYASAALCALVAACAAPPPESELTERQAEAPAQEDPQDAEPAPDPDDAPPPVNCGGELTRPAVDLSWTDGPTQHEVKEVDAPGLALSLKVDAPVPVAVELWAQVNAAGVTRRVPLGLKALDAGEASQTTVDPKSLGATFANLPVAASLVVEARIFDEKGRHVETQWSPELSLHEDKGSLLVYDAETRTEVFAKGDLTGMFDAALLADPLVLSVSFHDEAAQQAVEAQEKQQGYDDPSDPGGDTDGGAP